ncbi:WD40 repeat-like protein [Crepidotus variabilis]|uniref:WD40 repeat-like protein n=1 Tax=Crepidotus variabilis TaxID=179855 RepID=A0A9P6JSN7_9AGAR|nr:WD40 repeat-like protein [Crepidotus variabilis]
MRFTDLNRGLPISASSDGSPDHAGPSSLASGSVVDGPIAVTNGHTNGFGPMTNGSAVMGNGVQKRGKMITKVNLPGTTLYNDSMVDREEFVRLVIQSLRDVGYIESAATLEAESGYTMESLEVSQFRRYILEGLWSKAEVALETLGVEDEEGFWDAKFLIRRQKYLELVEARKPTTALHVLRNELAPLKVDPDQLHTLSSLIMCSEPEDLRNRAGWDGASGTSRQHLLDTLHEYIPSTVMIPQRRFTTLLEQARSYQRQKCVYHNPRPNTTFSLYTDHRCSKFDFPRITTTILEVHTDEVWNIGWSHDGNYLASASRDKSAIIWRRGSSNNSTSPGEWTAYLVLRDHQDPVGCLAWSLDDKVLLTSSEQVIKMWNASTGACIRTLEDHTETVTALAWLPDGSGFISGGLDRKITIWNADGKLRDSWGTTAIRLTDFSITPDFKRLIAVGMEDVPPYYPPSEPTRDGSLPPGGVSQPVTKAAHRMLVFDLATKQTEFSVKFEGDLTSVKTSEDSKYLLINHSPNEVQIWDLRTMRTIRRYSNLKQSRHVIRSCFGGVDENFIVSGSEDATVYVWHRESGDLLESLKGHGEGSVNSVSWNPKNERMFASCSDDRTIRIWEAPGPGMYAQDASSEKVPVQPSSASTLVEKGKGKTKQASALDGSEGRVDSIGTWIAHDHHI